MTLAFDIPTLRTARAVFERRDPGVSRAFDVYRHPKGGELS